MPSEDQKVSSLKMRFTPTTTITADSPKLFYLWPFFVLKHKHQVVVVQAGNEEGKKENY